MVLPPVRKLTPVGIALDSSGNLYIDDRANHRIRKLELAATPSDPDNYPADFAAAADSDSQITTTWTDASSGRLPEHYLVMCSTSDSFTAPTDGITQADDSDCADGAGVMNVEAGIQAYVWTGLDAGTDYYFRIYSYRDSDASLSYKTDGTAPNASAATDPLVVTFTGTTPSNGATASLAIAGGPASISSASFVPPPAGTGVPDDEVFPYDMVDFTLKCAGGTCTGPVTITLTYPQAIPAGAKFWKACGCVYSPYPATISGNTVTYSITDNGSGDDNAAAGVIHDSAGFSVVATRGDGSGSAGSGVGGSTDVLGVFALLLSCPNSNIRISGLISGHL